MKCGIEGCNNTVIKTLQLYDYTETEKEYETLQLCDKHYTLLEEYYAEPPIFCDFTGCNEPAYCEGWFETRRPVTGEKSGMLKYIKTCKTHMIHLEGYKGADTKFTD